MCTRRIAVAAVVAFVIGIAATQAASFHRLNHLTFSGPVSLPGVTLAPGTYTFEAGPQGTTDLSIVRVTTRNGRMVLYQGFTTLVARPRGNVPMVTFGEAPAGQAAPIKVWYPTQSTIGHQFRY
jgi:hypothetical protein